MDKVLLGRILATVATAAIGAGEIALSSSGHPVDSTELDNLFKGFLDIWMPAIKGQGTAA